MKTARWVLVIASILLGVLILMQIFGPPTGLLSSGLLWILAAVCGWLLVFLLPKVAWRARAQMLLIAGGLNLLALLIPTALLVELNLNLGLPKTTPAAGALGALLYLLPCAALVLVALLLQAGAQPDRPEREAAACLLLAALLLAKTLHNFYWLLVWDGTDDSLDMLWMIPPVFVAVVAALSLVTTLKGRARWVGFYALFIPVLLVAVAGNGDKVDFRQLTQQRAERIAHRLQVFREQEGYYPTDLRYLRTPRYLLAIPGPVTIYARQTWCYVSDGKGYQLGAVYRDHWSAPLVYGKTFAEGGQTAALSPLCADELTALRPIFADFVQIGPPQ